jgi:hypothetical protein
MLLQPQYAALQNAVVFAPRFYDPSKAPTVNRGDGLIVTGSGDPVNGLVVGGSQFPETAKLRIPNWNDPLLQRLFRGLPKEISPFDYGTFGPRIGFAYDLTGRQRTVVRGGWGLFYERVQATTYLAASTIRRSFRNRRCSAPTSSVRLRGRPAMRQPT